MVEEATTEQRIRTVPAYMGGGIWAGSVAQVHDGASVGEITEPVTFTADKAPYVVLT